MKVSDFKKRQEAAARELEKLSGDLDKLKEQRDTLAEEINEAIDADDFAEVEKLTAKQGEYNNRIRAMEMIIARKEEISQVKSEKLKAEIIAANNVDMKDYQKKIDKAQEIAADALKEYLSKLLDVAIIVNQAWTIRTQYAALIPDIEDPSTMNVQTSDFNHVSTSIKWEPVHNDILRSIKPDAIDILNCATHPRTNIFVGRGEAKRPNVTISKSSKY